MKRMVTIAAYQRVPLTELRLLRARWLALCKGWGIKGTIVLSAEGINLSIAGGEDEVGLLLQEFRNCPGLGDMAAAIHAVDQQPFPRLQVLIQRELSPELPEAESTKCLHCHTPLTEAERVDAFYVRGKACIYCREVGAEEMRASIAQRQEAIRRAVTPLPGSVARDNYKSINVPQACDGYSMLQALECMVGQVSAAQWAAECDCGRVVTLQQEPVVATQIVRAGERYRHIFPKVVEPDVNGAVEILHEDGALIVLNKPAPLPMHAGGRFFRNTLQHILNEAYHPEKPHPAHRLDANTTGLVLVTRSRHFAGRLQPQFARGTVKKVYLVLVQGCPSEDSFRCDAPISGESGDLGSRTVDFEKGLAAQTEFRVIRRNADGTALLEAQPLTGRTNQIRVHLWYLGLPVCGDAVYLPGLGRGEKQTLAVGDPPLCLHAWRVEFQHPLTRRDVEFVAPPPEWAGLT